MRKSLSKKKRFDVFKRDQFQCQYCGNTPPSVVLEVDHINPVSKGGDNSIDNLITSCFDCNRGKSADTLDKIPETIKTKASIIKEREIQIKEYNKILKDRADRIDEECWNVIAMLESDDYIEEYNTRRAVSIKTFLKRLPYYDVLDAAEITAMRFGHIGHNQFKFFCGVCWNKIKGNKNA